MAAPVLSSGVTYEGVDDVYGDVTTDSSGGTVYVLVDQNATRTAAQVKAGGGVDSDSVLVSVAGVVQTPVLTGLTGATAYYLHFVHENADGLSNVINTAFTTNSALTYNANADAAVIYDGTYGSFSGSYTPGANSTGVCIVVRTGSYTDPIDVQSISIGGVAMRCIGQTFVQNHVNGVERSNDRLFFLETAMSGSQTVLFTADVPSTAAIQLLGFTIAGGVPKSWRIYHKNVINLPTVAGAFDSNFYNNPVSIEAEDVMFGIHNMRGFHSSDTLRFDASTPATTSLSYTSGTGLPGLLTGLNPSSDITGMLSYRTTASTIVRSALAVIFSPRKVKGLGLDEAIPLYVYPRTTGSTTRDLVITGPVLGGTAPPAIQARIITQDGTEVTSWATLTNPSITTTEYSGTIENIPMNNFSAVSLSNNAIARYDKMYLIEVRRTDNPTRVHRGVSPFMVGLVLIMCGQSNAGNGYVREGVNGLQTPGYTCHTATSGPTTPDQLWCLNEQLKGCVMHATEVVIQNCGTPVMSALLNQSGVKIDYLVNPANTVYTNVMNFVSRVGHIDGIVWHQGEADSVNGQSLSTSVYAAYLSDFAAAVKSQSGQTEEVHVFVTSLGTTNGEGYGDADWTQTNNCLYNVGNYGYNLHYCSSNFDGTLEDGIHFNSAYVGKWGQRMGRTIANVLGGASLTEAKFSIASAARLSPTLTDVTLTHYLGNDFTPSSGIDGFEVSQDGTNWITPSASVRQTSNTVRLTHSAISGGTYYLRYMYGKNPTKTNRVMDNSALSLGTVPLQPTGANIEYNQSETHYYSLVCS